MTNSHTYSRRHLLGAAASGVAATSLIGVAGSALAGGDEDTEDRSPLETEVTLTWLGNNAWHLASGDIDILIDPWLTRFHTGTYSEEGADPQTPLSFDPAIIDRYVDRCNHVLVTHGHYDHLTDVPYIAQRTGATVTGTETHLNLLRAMDTPDEQLSTVSGGEVYEYEGYTVEVLPAAHSAGGPRRRLPFPGTLSGRVPDRPTVIADLVEGGSLAYLITIGDVSILNFGSSNYIGRAIEGLRPTVAMVMPSGGGIPGYVPRLMECLGNPRYLLPTHWDDFDEPLEEPAVDWGGLDGLRQAVTDVGARTEFVVVDHLESFTPR